MRPRFLVLAAFAAAVAFHGEDVKADPILSVGGDAMEVQADSLEVDVTATVVAAQLGAVVGGVAVPGGGVVVADTLTARPVVFCLDHRAGGRSGMSYFFGTTLISNRSGQSLPVTKRRF